MSGGGLWRRRLDAKKTEGPSKAVAAVVDEEEVSRAGMMNMRGRNPQAACRGRQGVPSATISPTMPPWGYVPSPGYYDGDAHGGFNPNTTFPYGTPQRSSPTGFDHDPRTPSPAFSTSKQDECLAEAWKTVSIDPITGANQNTDTYSGRIETSFDERKLVDPDFANIHMDNGEKATVNPWSTIQTAYNKWHGIVEEVATRPKSGANVEDQEFKFLHVFSRIDSCEKWREVRLALEKAKETYNPDAPSMTVVEGRPDGTKKAKAMRDVALSCDPIEQCIADVKISATRREEKSDVWWSALMINIVAKKRNTDLEFFIVANKRNTDLEFFMGRDTSTMDEKVKAWYIVQCDLILSQVPTPTATTTAPSPNAETTPTTSLTTPMTNNPTTPTMSPTTLTTSPTSLPAEEPHHAEPTV
ncbi:hypothetical protein ZWY2020_040835 [Hordeum vulgare]|nr:hypothetical protein ZWY2020_040835 [Hordeum vulgare]